MFCQSLRFVAISALVSLTAFGCDGDAPREGGLRKTARTIVVATAATAAGPAAPTAVLAETLKPRDVPSQAADRAPAKAHPKASGADLAVKKLVIGTGVERGTRQPVGVAQTFTRGEFDKIVAYVELANPGDESEVVVSFDPPSDAAAKGNVRLDVGTSPRWRTWASTKGISEKGEWAAVVRAHDGRELARETFVVL